MERYEALKMEIIAFETEDVIATSIPQYYDEEGQWGGYEVPNP